MPNALAHSTGRMKLPRPIGQHVGHDCQRGRQDFGEGASLRESQHQTGNRRQAIDAHEENRRNAGHSGRSPRRIQRSAEPGVIGLDDLNTAQGIGGRAICATAVRNSAPARPIHRCAS